MRLAEYAWQHHMMRESHGVLPLPLISPIATLVRFPLVSSHLPYLCCFSILLLSTCDKATGMLSGSLFFGVYCKAAAASVCVFLPLSPLTN